MNNLENRRKPLVDNSFGKTWLGCLVTKLGADWQKVYCRGSWSDLDWNGEILRFNTETAWGPMNEVFKLVKETYPSLEIYYMASRNGKFFDGGYSGVGKDVEPIASFVEVESGRHNDRPKLQEALKMCRKEKATLIVAKLDRLSRNVAFTSRLLESDVEIKFCDFPEANRLVLHIISSISEYEANLIRTRTKQALDAKRARGESLGKPENFKENQEKAIANSRKTIKAKADSNPNNKRAVAMLRVLVKNTTNLSEMARVLNQEGFTTSRGGQFTAQQVKILLQRYDINNGE